MNDRRQHPRATPRQVAMLALFADGLTIKEVAMRLRVSANTVKRQIRNAGDRSGLYSARIVELVWLYRRDIERERE